MSTRDIILIGLAQLLGLLGLILGLCALVKMRRWRNTRKKEDLDDIA